MEKKPICGIKHFERMIHSYKKISREQIDRNEHLKKHHFYYLDKFFNEPYVNNDSVFHILLKALLNKFKQNPYKIKSGFDWVYQTDGFVLNNYKFWVSYTVEDNFRQSEDNNKLSDKSLVFKIHMQVDNHRKKKISSWSIPITWN
jgi:hypothetical protein